MLCMCDRITFTSSSKPISQPQKAITQLKAFASRALNRSGKQCRKRWSRHGSTKYLWGPSSVDAAVDYVVQQQGPPMAVYLNPIDGDPDRHRMLERQ